MGGVSSRSTIATPDIMRGEIVLNEKIKGSGSGRKDEDDAAAVVADEEVGLKVMVISPLNILGRLVMGHNVSK
jgi:hypothetical protein